jgi:hypothetical protein
MEAKEEKIGESKTDSEPQKAEDGKKEEEAKPQSSEKKDEEEETPKKRKLEEDDTDRVEKKGRKEEEKEKKKDDLKSKSASKAEEITKAKAEVAKKPLVSYKGIVRGKLSLKGDKKGNKYVPCFAVRFAHRSLTLNPFGGRAVSFRILYEELHVMMLGIGM